MTEAEKLISNRTVILFTGSRSLRNYWEFSRYVREYLKRFERDSIVLMQGESFFGVDRMARIFAKRNNYELIGVPANWNDPELKNKRAAGMIRNTKMLNVAKVVIGWWDGESKGTRHAIDNALRKRLIVDFKECRRQSDWEERNYRQLWRIKNSKDRAVSAVLYD